MLKLSNAVIDQPVLSLRTGGPIAIARAPIINPNNLKIEGFYCFEDSRSKEPLALITQDIREWIPQGFAVNDYDDLTPPDELVRLQPIMKLEFELLGKPVYTQNKKRLGRLNDYAVDTDSFMVQKLYVSQSIVKNFTGAALSIDRDQIVEITDKRIIVKDPLQGLPHTAAAPAGA